MTSAARLLPRRCPAVLLHRRHLCSSNAALSAREHFAGLGSGSVSLAGADTAVATLTLHNPARRNSLSGAMMADLANAMDELERSSAPTVVLLQGEGGFFCSGADLTFARDHLVTPEQGAQMCALMQDTLTRLRRLPSVSVAAVEGGAVGGGTELSLACDYRVFAEDASFRMVQAKMGVSPGWGGGVRLVRLVGRRRAIELLCGAHKLSAPEALRLGVADFSLAPPGEARAHAESLLRDLLSGNDPAAVRGCKEVVAAGDDFDYDLSLRREAEVFASLWGGPSNREAVAPRGN